MNKPEITRLFAEKYNYTYKSSIQICNDICDFITEMMIAGETLHLNNLGTFSVKTVQERPRYDIAKGEMSVSPSKRVPKFQFSDIIKFKVANTKD